jgi:hypothetical protein
MLIGLVAQVNGVQSTANRKTDLSGTWVMDRAKSEPKPTYEESTLTINYEEPALTIHRYSRSKDRGVKTQSTYYCDGRGEVDPVTELKSITRWKGDSLTISYQGPEYPSKRLMDTIEVWSISDQGKRLTIKVYSQPAEGAEPASSVSSSARRIFLWVYRRGS